ncbi:hypothetical protein [Candidatus Accumulibacter vicinus]|nr:hypothetical protein [Candidatus Accumulibacter vicinus]
MIKVKVNALTTSHGRQSAFAKPDDGRLQSGEEAIKRRQEG